MADTREKLIELLQHDNCPLFMVFGDKVDVLADYLIANGVTVQELDGCEYCNDKKSVYYHSSGIHDSMDEDVYVSGNNLVVDIGCHSYGTAEIKLCPMCGRKLPEPPKGD